MAEKGEKRNPVTHRTPSQTKRHRETYQSTPKQKAIATRRKQLRREAEREGIVRKGDGKDLSHVRAISKGGGDSMKNIRVQSRSKNRGHGMTKGSKPNKGR